MKKILLMFCLFFITIISGCFDSSSSSSSSTNPVLSVNPTYTGSLATISATKPIRVEAYITAAGVTAGAGSGSSFYGDYAFSSSSSTQSSSVAVGTYYFLAYVDLNNDLYISTGEPYIIYSSKTKTDTPTPVALALNLAETVSLTFGDSNLW